MHISRSLCLCALALVLALAVANAHLARRGKFQGALNHGLLARTTSAADRAALEAELLQRRAGGEAPPEYQWFTQTLDHFDPQNTATWQQRYLVNGSLYQAGGPVFLMLGGEGPMTQRYVTGHFIINDYAAKFNAMVVALEHRFYGDSQPTGDTTTASLRYLSSQQALADAATFRAWFATQNGLDASAPWIVFGGSYSGALSGWARLKYPHLFQGSVATSAPVEAQLDFAQYFEVVAHSVGATCAAQLAAATNSLTAQLQSADGRDQLQQQFNTCKPIDSYQDVAVFLDALAGSVSEVVQYAGDNNQSPLTEAIGIAAMCNVLESNSDAVAAWQAFQVDYYQASGDPSPTGACLDVSYDDYIAELQNTSVADTAARAWTWQYCNEFGYLQTGDGADQPFSPMISLEFFLQQCQDAFDQQLTPNVNWTNAYYGGRSIGAASSNTIFPNGNVDPWHALGVRSVDASMQNYAVLINGTAHCADLYAPSPSDLPGLTAARQLEVTAIGQWLGL